MRLSPILLSSLLLLLPLAPVVAEEAWLIGTWRLDYDPDGAPTDYLEFKANGDLISRGEHGEAHGFYMIVPGAVRGVLTHNGRDLLLTFFYSKDKTRLRIVTSASGIESIYIKVRPDESSPE